MGRHSGVLCSVVGSTGNRGESATGSSDDYLIIRGTTGIRKALRSVGEDNSAWYSINGHRLTAKPSRGLYIKGGKKIFVK